MKSSSVNTLVQCIEACSKTDGCIAAAFTSNTCWQKNVRAVANVNVNVDAIYKISSGSKSATTTTTTSASSTTTTATPATSGTGICYNGASPKSTKTASNGDKYGICPGNDFYGGDLPNQPVPASNMKACYETCSKTTGCVAVAFEFNDCYLKSTRNVASVVSFVDVAYKVDGKKVSSDLSSVRRQGGLTTCDRLLNVRR